MVRNLDRTGFLVTFNEYSLRLDYFIVSILILYRSWCINSSGICIMGSFFVPQMPLITFFSINLVVWLILFSRYQIVDIHMVHLPWGSLICNQCFGWVQLISVCFPPVLFHSWLVLTYPVFYWLREDYLPSLFFFLNSIHRPTSKVEMVEVATRKSKCNRRSPSILRKVLKTQAYPWVK